LNNSNALELIDLAKEAFNDGQFERAEKILSQVLGVHNRDPQVFQMLGTIYYDQGKFNKAIKTFKRALDIDPEYTDASVGLSIVLNDIGKYEEGQDVFLEAQKKLERRKTGQDPYVEQKIGRKHAELGELYFQYKRFTEACDEYIKARRLLADKEALTLRIAECFVKSDNDPMAIRELYKYLKNSPQANIVRVRLGQILYQNNKVTEAVDQWENVLMRDPDNSSARKYLRTAHQAGLTLE
jgi:tetratricopeptide (TPR) repeat protein